ncbi:MAG: DUF1990 domain-containing protein [Pseudoclavibacter sp.]|nr:DUF1990 domain-containing protein [Pseudoclavibacter sp.]
MAGLLRRSGPRRSTIAEEPVCNYAAVGATALPDLLLYPPRGFAAAQHQARLGSGEARWERSIARLMRWGVQRGAGLGVEEVRSESLSGDAYRSIVHEEDGEGAASMRRPYAHLFDAADPELIRPGMTARIVTRTAGMRFVSPVRVIAVIAEPNAFGFSIGTLPGGPEACEQRFIVSRNPDGTVWITVRELVRPAALRSWAVWPLAKRHRARVMAGYLAALHPATPLSAEEAGRYDAIPFRAAGA